MAFFRKWKTHYKHKKFTSNEAIDGEEFGLDKSIKDLNMKLDINGGGTGGGIEADDEEDNKPLFASYNIKYLGCTPIEAKRSEKVTSEAIKTVIANSKAGGRKNKSQKSVQLNVSQDGVEVLDQKTQESLMRFSIYKISYCSVDASHNHAFSFVSSETDPISNQEKMSCHVFNCPKIKIAHEITLMVARCFENAYHQWRETVVQGINFGDNNVGNKNKVLKKQNGGGAGGAGGVIESKAEVYQPQHKVEECKSDNLLIDLAATDNDVRKFLQNSWVSFEDDAHEGGGVHIMAY